MNRINSLRLVIIVVVILATAIFLIFFKQNTSKILNNGNNMSSQEIVNYILNISSYKTNVTVEINSNKNSNKYIINQEYIYPNINIQEVIEPDNISGIRIVKDDNGVKVENTKLSLSTIFENYKYIENNYLDLIAFINDYKNCDTSTYEEINNQIVMHRKYSNGKKYIVNKTLYIEKETCNPVKLEIKDDNQKTIVNILYNEVQINNN